MKAHQGKVNNYLGMIFEYEDEGKVKVDMSSYVKKMLDEWYVDASFTVHPDFRSQTGGTMTFGKGAVQWLSKKQRLNTRSSTEAELVGADDVATQILWTKHFMEVQGYMIKENILHQDNKSTIFIAREWEEKHREVVTSSEREIFFPHGSSQEREPKDNLLSHR